MSLNEEILTKAIEKAIEGGWDVDLDTVLPEMQKKWSLYGLKYTGCSGLLFSKDFAKALWGTKLCLLTMRFTGFDGTQQEETKIPYWQMHLQQMVISPNPIAYLGENI